ncbi:MAG: hypothetical protein H6740_04465 [Alphaproteobacteria bacterium]|nr:hypothetical protein [Alphaproteobacteria bacterium]
MSRPLPPVPAEHVPAAHSMDSCWFAIDQDGEVGLFETGEDGALPEFAAMGSGSASANFDEDAFFGFIAARLHAAGEEQPSCELAEGGRPVILVDDIEAWHEVQQSKDVLTLRWGPPHALMPARRLDQALLRKLEGLPRVGVLDTEQVHEQRWEEEFIAPLGLHAYVADDWGNPGNYGRVGEAVRPVRVEELPHAVQQDIQQMRLKLRFREAERLHLADHPEVGVCHTWSDSDLRGYPKPGAKAPAGDKPASALWVWILLALMGAALLFMLLR